jgi:hypothetical protein
MLLAGWLVGWLAVSSTQILSVVDNVVMTRVWFKYYRFLFRAATPPASQPSLDSSSQALPSN